MRKTTLVGALILLCFGCSSGGSDKKSSPPGPRDILGAAQKGPFSASAQVTVSALNSELEPSGLTWVTQTSSDLGTFSVTVESRYVQVDVVGYYFDERTNALSPAPLTLRALADLEQGTTVNVNVLTTLEVSRIRALRSSGLTFAEAEAQARNEALAVFRITNLELGAPASSFSIASTSTGGTVVLAVSALANEVASRTADKTSTPTARLTDMLASIGSSLPGNGGEENAIGEAGMIIDVDEVIQNLESRLGQSGQSVTLKTFEPYIDRDGDGVMNRNDDDPVPAWTHAAPGGGPWYSIFAFEGELYGSDAVTTQALHITESAVTQIFWPTPIKRMTRFDATHQVADSGVQYIAFIVQLPDGSGLYNVAGDHAAVTGSEIAYAANGNAYLIDGLTNTPIVTLTKPTSLAISFGASLVATSDEIIVGGYAIGAAGGAVVFFDKTGNVTRTLSNGAPGFGATLALSGASLFVGTTNPYSVSEYDVATGILQHVFAEPSGGFGQSMFGRAIAVDDDYVVISAPNRGVVDIATCGMVFVYDRSSRELLYQLRSPSPLPDSGDCEDFFGQRMDLLSGAGIGASDVHGTLYFFPLP